MFSFFGSGLTRDSFFSADRMREVFGEIVADGDGDGDNFDDLENFDDFKVSGEFDFFGDTCFFGENVAFIVSHTILLRAATPSMNVWNSWAVRPPCPSKLFFFV